jgi:lipopolysaccharide/colanic/teichoic acid biosynthesis glycosyltransferase
MSRSAAQTVIKRCFDVFFAVVLLALLSPVLITLSLLVAVFLGWPVLFVQQRPGLRGKPFLLRKFRTMTDAVDAKGVPRTDAERLTRFGRMLRSTSLDELPELWNVLVGEMSFVGPRPLLMEYLPLYSREQMRRHEVLPGITGWAQVNGRNALTWEEKFAFDLWYVEHASFMLDLRILWLTVTHVVTARGVSQAGHVTMPRFKGEQR